MRILLDNYEAETNLGPDTIKNKSGIWVHGCDKNCKGCITSWNRNSEPDIKISTFLSALMIAEHNPEMLVISGGEPFLQAEALVELIDFLNEMTDGKTGIMIYTGNIYEDLKNIPVAEELISRTDILVDGPYIPELDDNNAFRGSSNQRIIFTSERYCTNIFRNTARNTRITFRNGEALMTGIPSADVRELWYGLRDSLQKGL